MTRIIFAFAVLYAVTAFKAEPVDPKASDSTSVVTKENHKKIRDKKGKWSEADVLALLGRPDRFSILPGGILEMVWEDVNRVRVEVVKGKAEYLWGEFSQKNPSKSISLENFRKLRTGMTPKELEGVMGAKFEEHEGPEVAHGNLDAIPDLTVAAGSTLYVWQTLKRLSVQFAEGKVSGDGWAEW